MPALLERIPKPSAFMALVERHSDRLLGRIIPDTLAEAGHCSCSCDMRYWGCSGCLICYWCYDCENGASCQGCHYNQGCC